MLYLEFALELKIIEQGHSIDSVNYQWGKQSANKDLAVSADVYAMIMKLCECEISFRLANMIKLSKCPPFFAVMSRTSQTNSMSKVHSLKEFRPCDMLAKLPNVPFQVYN